MADGVKGPHDLIDPQSSAPADRNANIANIANIGPAPG